MVRRKDEDAFQFIGIFQTLENQPAQFAGLYRKLFSAFTDHYTI
jgi:hypothetical protein